MNYQEMTDKDLKALFLAKMEESDLWLIRGLTAIYNQQTADEQMTKDTKHDNGRGFTGSDAAFLSSLAQQHHGKGYLSPKQMKFARRSMRKYAGQLVKITKGKI
jgi:phage protein D